MDATYLDKLQAQIEEKELGYFWIMTDRIDFKPIKEKSAQKVFNYLKNKAGYYKGKKIANVTIVVDKKQIKADGIVFKYKITIYKIDDDGNVAKHTDDTWGLKVNYKLDDFNIRKFKLKDLHNIIKLCADEEIDSDTFNGMSFRNFIKMLERKKINLDNM